MLQIPEGTLRGVRKYLGDDTERFISRAEPLLEKYSKRWRLSELTFMPTDTVNLLFGCESELYGPCVLKMCIPGPEVATEANCLRAYDGRGYVKLHGFDLSDDVLLLEKIIPGDQMWAVGDHRERARLTAELVKDLPLPLLERGAYPTYSSWMAEIRKKLVAMGDTGDALFYLDEGIRVYDELKRDYRRVCLLHGDLHQENMLLNSAGGYTVIDPKGVADDPVMETARFLMNETPCPEAKIREMTAVMSPIIGTPERDMLKSMYVDAALSHCWTLEEHFPSREAFETQKAEVSKICGFVYGLMK